MKVPLLRFRRSRVATSHQQSITSATFPILSYRITPSALLFQAAFYSTFLAKSARITRPVSITASLRATDAPGSSRCVASCVIRVREEYATDRFSAQFVDIASTCARIEAMGRMASVSSIKRTATSVAPVD